MRLRAVLAAMLMSVAFTASEPAGAASPSFDCAKASSWAEKQICGDDKLSALDAWLSPLFNQVVQRVGAKDADALKTQRKAWFKARNDCKTQADGNACLAQRYQEFIDDLEHRLAAVVGGGGAQAAAPPTGKSPLDQCSGDDKQACLEQLLDADETKLSAAESDAAKNAKDGDKVEASDLAWRGYRNAECKRRSALADADQSAGVYTACLIDLTRARLTDLKM